MKIAVSGKGGVGKTLLSAFLARAFAAGGYKVIAIDADPDANLGATLGFPDAGKIVPISHLKDLVRQRFRNSLERNLNTFDLTRAFGYGVCHAVDMPVG